MKKITIITMQLKTPGGIERFVSTIATMFSKNYSVEIVANYGRPLEPLAFPLAKDIQTTFLSPIQPQEISLKKIITSLKWHQIPKELIRRYKINYTRNVVFKKYLNDLDTDYIITDRALYNRLVNKYYTGKALKIATDHNHHQHNQKYIKELTSSLAGFTFLVVATQELKDFYQEKIKPVKCEFIPNPLPSIPTKKSPLLTKNIISVGRLVPEKDYSLLISAMEIIHQQNKDIKLTIIGDGLERQQLEQSIKNKHLDKCVKITGFLPQTAIAQYYYDSSLFALTSKTEAFGLALTEAMSYGLPCLALARASGARAQLNKTNGFLIDSDDPSVIAKKILYIFKNQDKLKPLQKNIEKDIKEKFSEQTIRKKWIELLDYPCSNVHKT